MPVRAKQHAAVAFDVDGVIIDSYWEFFHAMAVTLKDNYDVERLSPGEFAEIFMTGMYDGLKQLFNITSDKHKLFLRRFTKPLQVGYERCSLFPGMADVLVELAEVCKPIYLITSNVNKIVEAALKRDKKLEKVKFKILGASVRLPSGFDSTNKVHKIQYVHSRSRCEQFYYVGDTLGDMRDAVKANVIPIGVTWGWHAESCLRIDGDVTIAHTPEKLAQLIKNSSAPQ